MLFEILFFVTLLICPYACVFAFFMGFKSGMSAQTGKISVKLPLFREEEEPVTQETEQERLQRIINMNIENYGTDIPQMDVI